MNAIVNFLPLVASGMVLTQALVFIALSVLALFFWEDPRHDDNTR